MSLKKKTLRAIWLAACFVPVLGPWAGLWSWDDESAAVYLSLVLILLTFPAGLVPFFLAGWTAQIAYQQSGSLYLNSAINGLGVLAIVAAGYCQWFWLVPSMRSRAKGLIGQERHIDSGNGRPPNV